MLLGHIFNFTIISGIFKKSNENLDILPPPPPFPEIWAEEKTAKEAESYRRKLLNLYVKKNLTIGQIGKNLRISEKQFLKD